MPLDPIRPDRAPSLPEKPRGARPAGPSEAEPFRAHLSQARALKLNERIDQAMAQIDELGARLGSSLSLADLKRYKQAVGGLLKDLNDHMLQVKTSMEWDAQAWEHRTLITIRRVDEELEQLTQMILSQEQDRLAILAKIGEIKGMLLDVRM